MAWGEFDHGADGVAQFLLDLGAAQQDKVALYLYNCPEYLQATFGRGQGRPRPGQHQLPLRRRRAGYLWDNADAVAVVFHGAFAERIEGILDRVPGVKGWLWVDDGTGPCPDWATPYEDAAKSAIGRVHAPVGPQRRRPLHALHRRHHRHAQGRDVAPGRPLRPPHRQRRAPLPGRRRPRGRARCDHGQRRWGSTDRCRRCPLMHGTGSFTVHHVLAEGGRRLPARGPQPRPVELLDTIEREKVNALVIVGDPFGRPLLRALDAEPGPVGPELAHDDRRRRGAMWSEPVKQGLLAHHPGMMLVDAFSSSEALGMGASVSARGAPANTAKFTLGPDVKVLTDDGRAGASRARTRSACWPLGGSQPARLLQGRGEVGAAPSR